MDPTAVVRAIEALMSPLEWGSQDAWLAESLKRVRLALGQQESSTAAPADELEELLLPPDSAASDDRLPLVSMRCALASGLAMLHRMGQWRSTLEQVCDDMNA